MLNQIVVIAQKEVVDHVRETRSVLAAVMHLLMGPLVVLLATFSMAAKSNAKGASVVAAMMSVFTLVAAFIGSTNVAMDLMAGEREHRSLLPLLLNPISRVTVMIGKCLAACVFSLLGLALTLAAFMTVCKIVAVPIPLFTAPALLCWGLLGLAPLAVLAAALQLAVSTVCRTTKEAHTYLALLIFIPMGVAMFLVFLPRQLGSWTAIIPIAGQQAIAQMGLNTGYWSIPQAATLAIVTISLAAAILFASGKLLERDSFVYGC